MAGKQIQAFDIASEQISRECTGSFLKVEPPTIFFKYLYQD